MSSNVPTSRHHGAPKHGEALLAGLLRCRRCGRKLTLRYSGAKHHIPRYSCSRGWMDNGEPRCIAFGALRVDDAIEEALLTVVGPGAIAAAVAAEKEATQRRDQVREALKRGYPIRVVLKLCNSLRRGILGVWRGVSRIKVKEERLPQIRQIAAVSRRENLALDRWKK